jgi:hypothetical protein
MSGFLQRITGSAIRRQTNLHPLVAPVYAAARRDEAPALTFPEETQTVAATPREGPAGSTQTPDSHIFHKASFQPPLANSAPLESTQEAAAAKHAGQRGDSSSNENSILSLLGNRAFQPLLARLPDSPQESGAVSESPSEGVSAEFAARENTGYESSRSSKSASDSKAEAPAAPRPWDYEPLIASGAPMPSRSVAEAQGPQPSEPVRFPSELEATSRRASARQTVSSSNASQMRSPIQAEDIQIHIGRIEVIAVPPPSARPAAAPVRRGQSLDEYLRSSNGRPR